MVRDISTFFWLSTLPSRSITSSCQPKYILTMHHDRLKCKRLHVSSHLNTRPVVHTYVVSSACPESNCLRVLNHSNCMAGDRQGGLKPGEMVLSSPSWEDLSWTIAGLWEAIFHILLIIVCFPFTFSFSVRWLIVEDMLPNWITRNARVYISCIWAVGLSVTY